jgi:hypothetical protein
MSLYDEQGWSGPGAEVFKMQKCRSVAFGSMAEHPSMGECEDKGPRRRQKKIRYDKAEYHFVFLISFIFTCGIDTSFVFAYTIVDVSRISIIHFTKLLEAYSRFLKKSFLH